MSPQEGCVNIIVRNNRGFTVVELMIVLALLGGNCSYYMMLGLGNRVHSASVAEYELQSSARIAAARINRTARFASAVFTIPKSSFKEDNLTRAGVTLVSSTVPLLPMTKGLVRLCPSKDRTGTYQRNVTYEIVFHKVEKITRKIIGFLLTATLKTDR